MGGLAGKVAVLTGSGTGIGRSSALALAGEGANIVINYSKSESEALATVADIQKLGVQAIAIKANVGVRLEAEKLIADAHAAFGRIDVLVNSAGTTRFIAFPDLDKLDDEVWDSIMSTNLMAAFYTSRAASRHMLAQGDGAIVNISSVAGVNGFGSSLPYAVSKGAMITLTKSLARALAPVVRVNTVAPGVVGTRWIGDQQSFRDAQAAQTPMGRIATPEDVAAAVRYFAVDAAFVTGQVHIVDGGRII